jgi:hypothetical protein
MKFANSFATAPYLRQYPSHTTRSSQPQRAFAALAWRLYKANSNATQHLLRFYIYPLHVSRSSIAPSPTDSAKISNHPKGAVSKRRNCVRAAAMTTVKSAPTATHASPLQRTLGYPMQDAYSSRHMSNQKPVAEPRPQALHAQAAISASQTRTPSSTMSSRSKSAATAAACGCRVPT